MGREEKALEAKDDGRIDVGDHRFRSSRKIARLSTGQAMGRSRFSICFTEGRSRVGGRMTTPLVLPPKEKGPRLPGGPEVEARGIEPRSERLLATGTTRVSRRIYVTGNLRACNRSRSRPYVST